MVLVELLEGRLEQAGLVGQFAGGLLAGRLRSGAPPDREVGRQDGRHVSGQIHALDNAAAAHLEDLDGGAGRPRLDADRVLVAKRHGRHLLLPVAKRLDRAHGVAQLGRLLEALGPGRLAHPPPQRLDELVVAPLEKQARVGHGARVAFGEQTEATQGAMQRLMSYSRHGRERRPLISSLHDRMPNSRWVSAIVLRASEAGMNGPA